MTDSLEQQAERVIDRILELPAADRTDAADKACRGDLELLQRVRSLMGALPMVDGFLDVTVDAPHEISVTERPGTVIGRYKLLQQIGEGGFGVVFMAEQEKPVRRTVALKIIKLGMDTKEVVARFEAERQALALMDHPNIAKVLDAGATDTGRPYFVMELVRGSPITEYADKHKLSTRERVSLATQVCRAVQHAHGKGVIHRDLKPTNVLVTVTDDKPVPKVIDFGIAKATQSKLTDRTLFTAFRQMIGTPQYMSPEQADSDGSDVDTRTDVYSLGVLLYELLVGATPVDAKALRSAAYDAMRKMIRDTDVPRPATRLHTMAAESQSAIAASRSTDVKKLSESIKGELDWIVMKALEKDRTRRYETAAALADDLGRYLAGDAVLAGPVSGTYRLRKTLKRYKAAVAIGGAITACLLLGVAGTTWGLVEARRQRAEADNNAVKAVAAEGLATKQARAAEAARQEALAQRTEARLQADVAKAVGDFQIHMLAAADPRHRLGDKVTVLQTVTAAVAELDRGSLAAQPAVEAGVRLLIGHTFSSLSRDDLATLQFQRALDLRRQLATSDDDLDVAKSLRALANVVDRAQGCDLYRKVIAIDRRLLPADSPQLGCDLGHLARLLGFEHKPDEGTVVAAEALSIAEKSPSSRLVETTFNCCAVFFQWRDELPAAEKYYRRALAVNRQIGRDDLGTAVIMDNLADPLRKQGKLAEAALMSQGALEINRKYLPPDDPYTKGVEANLAKTMFAQADAQFRDGDFAGAKNTFATALSHRAKFVDYHQYVRLCGYLGDTAEYQKVCRELLTKFGTSPDAHEREGAARARLMLPPASPADLAGLADLLDYADQHTPDLPWPKLTRALLDYRSGDYDAARRLAEKVTPALEEWARPQGELVAAMAVYRLGRVEDGRTRLADVLAEVARQPKAGVDPLIGSYAMGYLDREQLIREARRLMGDGPLPAGDPVSSTAVAAERRVVDDAVTRAPDDTDAWRTRAKFHCKVAEFDQARLDYRRVLALQPGFADRRVYAQLSAFLGDTAEYHRACDQLRAEFGRSDNAVELEGIVCDCLLQPPERSDDLKPLADMLDRAASIDPASHWVVLTRAVLEYRLGHYEQALAVSRKAAVVIPQSALTKPTAIAAMSLARLNRSEEAAAEYRKMLDRKRTKPRAGVDLLSGNAWDGYLDREQITREAGQLIDPTGALAAPALLPAVTPTSRPRPPTTGPSMGGTTRPT